MDVRGYGGSAKPHAIAAYAMRNPASHVAAVIDALDVAPGRARGAHGSAILFGHDWSAPIVWNTALLHPQRVSAVAGLSVPFVPIGPVSFLDVARALYDDRFFYQLYLQAEGVAEAAFEADVRTALRKVNFALSGDAPEDKWLRHKPADAGLLDGLIDPEVFPAWFTEQDLQVFVDAFAAGGSRRSVLLPDVGHRVRQQAAHATNRVLHDLLSGLA